MRCARCNRRVKQNPVYYQGKLYGASCARKRGYREPLKVKHGESEDSQLDLFKSAAFESWCVGIDW